MTAQELEKKYANIEFKTTPKLYFAAALAEIDYHFEEGDITQEEWSKLSKIIHAWLKE
jgi:hypothetical protein